MALPPGYRLNNQFGQTETFGASILQQQGGAGGNGLGYLRNAYSGLSVQYLQATQLSGEALEIPKEEQYVGPSRTDSSNNDNYCRECDYCNRERFNARISAYIPYSRASADYYRAASDAHRNLMDLYLNARLQVNQIRSQEAFMGQYGSYLSHRCPVDCPICELSSRNAHRNQQPTSPVEPRVLRDPGRESTYQPSKAIRRKLMKIPQDRIRDILENENFFDGGYDCLSHRRYKCPECMVASYESMAGEELTSLALRKDEISFSRQIDAKDRFSNQVRFIKAGLDMSDAKLDKVKVKDLENLMTKAKNEITVGKMKGLLNMEGVEKLGVIDRLVRWIAKRFS